MAKSITYFFPGVKENIILAPYTTFLMGGPAKYFFEAKSLEDVSLVVKAAKEAMLPFLVLAGGSNMLIGEKGYQGIVILMRNNKWEISDNKVKAESGVSVSTLVTETAKHSLSGFEWAGGLPGSIGGAVRGNAGAFGGEVKDVVFSVTALVENGEIQEFSNKECGFSYRDSIFKQKGFIVLSCEFLLKKGKEYEIQNIAKDHILYRKERHPMEYPSAGSVFKNCDLKLFSQEMQEKLFFIVKRDPFPVVPTAYLISEAGLKGFCIGNAQISEKHPNYIINLGGGTADDVLKLIAMVKQKVKEKFFVDLEEEIQCVL